jgi:hypothetical protein
MVMNFTLGQTKPTCGAKLTFENGYLKGYAAGYAESRHQFVKTVEEAMARAYHRSPEQLQKQGRVPTWWLSALINAPWQPVPPKIPLPPRTRREINPNEQREGVAD